MKRLRRHISNVFTALSLLLCLATTVMWVGSYWRVCDIVWVHDFPSTNRLIQWHCVASSARGGFDLLVIHDHATTTESINSLLSYHRFHPIFETWSSSLDEADRVFSTRVSYLLKSSSRSALGFQFSSNHGVFHGYHYWNWGIAIPYWFPLTVFIIPPLLWLRQRNRRRIATMTGKCHHCGYDLHATPDRCPECGSVPEKSVGITA